MDLNRVNSIGWYHRDGDSVLHSRVLLHLSDTPEPLRTRAVLELDLIGAERLAHELLKTVNKARAHAAGKK